jgi:hypothetical protein
MTLILQITVSVVLAAIIVGLPLLGLSFGHAGPGIAEGAERDGESQFRSADETQGYAAD